MRTAARSSSVRRWCRRHLRKAKSVEELLRWLYLKGISTGDFSEALAALLGPDAEGLSSSTITRLKAAWWDEYEAWRKRELKEKRLRLHLGGRGPFHAAHGRGSRGCMLVILSVPDEYGEKDVLAIMDGFRENADSWRALLQCLKKRGLAVPPELAIGDGALGFWIGYCAMSSPRSREHPMLGSQDRQRHRRDAQVPQRKGQGRSAGHLDG